ncbi:hypothetical protein DPEC_G00062090 [Dallia pectoralis]|uniref:Uncharacterized protein n=1 Tax=Dallia pectoralis TaxID=75939 RepID=A0ACC2H7G3_DALPE|nr:hypothetical protein DPEC_G00062090 [Dallia pectoralis]
MVLDQQTLILRLIQPSQQNAAEYAIEDGLLPPDGPSLQRLETDLLKAEFKVKLINHLSIVGGSNLKDAAWRVMGHTISNSLAKTMNWRGINGKTSLASRRLKDVFIAAVRKTPKCSTATERDIEAAMKKWLQLAPDSEGGRRDGVMFQLPKGGDPDNPLLRPTVASKGSIVLWCEKRTTTSNTVCIQCFYLALVLHKH